MITNTEKTSLRDFWISVIRFERQEWILILVPALGYFVDLFDVLLFSAIGSNSLKGLGIPATEIGENISDLLNIQLIGMVIGGYFWGIIADRIGRLKMLLSSIIIYSIATVANGFIENLDQYYVCRFIAGFGLAGELGTGITHIVETLDIKKRTAATSIIGILGMLGPVAASALTIVIDDWRVLYFIGGILGFGVYFSRRKNHESILFQASQVKHKNKFLKQSLALFMHKDKLIKYFSSILVGIPVFFFVGILISRTNDFAQFFGIQQTATAPIAIIITYSFIAVGEFFGGYLSKKLSSRKKVIRIFLIIQFIALLIFFFVPTANIYLYYSKYIIIGFGIGYWALMVTNAAEIFGTNLRATVTTTVPNLIRGSLYIITLFWKPLIEFKGVFNATLYIGIIVIFIAFIASFIIPDRFEQELNFDENI